MRGDLLFWPSDGTPTSRLIALGTNGPFVHVSVDLGDGTDIGAHAEDGVQRHIIPETAHLTRWSPSGKDSEPGIQFLTGELGDKYGFCNILNALLGILHLPYRISRIDRYDCSSLVTRYLERIGVWLGDLSEEPDSVSPNDLARALKLLPS